MFQFTGFPPSALCVQAAVARHYPYCVSTFGHLRIYACVQLPAAFRSLPRPSSAPGAKASSICSFLLDPKGLFFPAIILFQLVSACIPADSPCLSLLYTCMRFSRCACDMLHRKEIVWRQPHMVGSSGLEPPTSRLSGVRSNQLSYEPKYKWWR